MTMNRQEFFREVKASLFRGRFSQRQVDGLNQLLDVWESSYLNWPMEELAYNLATAKHETAETMQPIKEYGGASRAERLYGPHGSNPARAKRMGNTRAGDGARYMGRGYVQLTWKTNYGKATDHLRDMGYTVNLVSEPERAMDPGMAAHILFYGNHEGLWTGRGLPQYIQEGAADYVEARRVVNGTDKARLIAGYAAAFEEALEAAARVPPAPPQSRVATDGELSRPVPTPPPGREVTTEKPWSSTIITSVISGISAVVTAGSQFFDQIRESLGPWPTVVLCLGMAGIAVYIVRERQKKRREYGV